MSWPQPILTQFTISQPNPTVNPYNTLLHHLFPLGTPFMVAPRVWEVSGRETLAYEVVFYLKSENKPVFILVPNGPMDLKSSSSRQDIDDQIRRKMGDLRAECPIPTLHAVSAMGNQLCFYCVPSGTADAEILPAIEHTPVSDHDAVPADYWDCNILDEGEVKLRTVVDEIRKACATLEQ